MGMDDFDDLEQLEIRSIRYIDPIVDKCAKGLYVINTITAF